MRSSILFSLRPLRLCGSIFSILILAGGCPGDPLDAARPRPAWFNAGIALRPADLTEEPQFTTQPIFDSIEGRSGSHAPTITVLADGALLAAWYSYEGPEERDGAAIFRARRPAGATVWDAPQLHIDRPETDGNPVLYSEGERVWLFQAVTAGGWSLAHAEVQSSWDSGVTWSGPESIGGPLGTNVKSPPVRLSSGQLLLPAYDDLLQRSLFFVSGDDGAKWSLRSDITTPLPFQNLQPAIALRTDGSLLAVMRNAGRGWLWMTTSNDDGRSWSPAADSGFANSGSAAALARLVSGRLLLVFNDSPDRRTPLSATISPDDGATWSIPRILIEGDGDFAYPAIAQSPDGLIHMVYSHNRERIEHVTVNESWLFGD